ncbi:MAG: amino acid permease [Acidobacteriota bacterium]|nr:amino acid permease [Acidobacteriota bacterium]
MREADAHSGFRRELGLFDAVVVVAGGIIGVGIFANTSNTARVIAEPVGILFVWALGGMVALIGGFVWAELASRLPHVGGQYVYLTRAYPRIVGFLYGVALLFIINGGGLAAVSILFASNVDRAYVGLGATGIKLAAAATLVILTAVNAIGVKAGKRANNVFMAAKVVGMLALVALAFGGRSTPASDFGVAAVPLDASVVSTLFTALVPVLFAYGGWQSCASIAGEIRDPGRNLPRATVLGVVGVVTLYLALNVAYLWVLSPAEVAASPALAADVARAVAGDAGARFVSALIVVSSLGFLAVIIMTGPRLCYAMAQDGVFFPQAGRLHPRYRTPVFALWFQTGMAVLLIATNSYDQLLSYVVFADWLFFGLTAGAVFILRRRGSTSTSVARTPGHPYTTGLFVAIAAGVVLNSFVAYPTQSLSGTGILAAAAVAYLLFRRQEVRRAGA